MCKLMQSFKSVIRWQPLEKNPRINKRRGTFIPESRVQQITPLKCPTENNCVRYEFMKGTLEIFMLVTDGCNQNSETTTITNETLCVNVVTTNN